MFTYLGTDGRRYVDWDNVLGLVGGLLFLVLPTTLFWVGVVLWTGKPWLFFL